MTAGFNNVSMLLASGRNSSSGMLVTFKSANPLQALNVACA